MTTPLSKTELVRTAWIAALRREGHRQCTEYYYLPSEGLPVCALGLLMEIAGMPLSDSTEQEDIGGLAGLSYVESYDIAARNDGGATYRKHTFAEIADVVERWFKFR